VLCRDLGPLLWIGFALSLRELEVEGKEAPQDFAAGIWRRRKLRLAALPSMAIMVETPLQPHTGPTKEFSKARPQAGNPLCQETFLATLRWIERQGLPGLGSVSSGPIQGTGRAPPQARSNRAPFEAFASPRQTARQ
jgi:hypothetical protein